MNFNEITRIIIYRHFPHTHHSQKENSIIQYFTSHFHQKTKKMIPLTSSSSSELGDQKKEELKNEKKHSFY